jgi:NAD(P)-dependent dehydrogenase (short-subunit alcohol dehydrogenase family)
VGERDLAHRRRSSPEEDGMAERLTALIVGASRGLGLALAEEWLKRDARVIATVRSDSEELKTLQERFPSSLEIKIVDVVDVASVRPCATGLVTESSTCCSSMPAFAGRSKKRRRQSTSRISST